MNTLSSFVKSSGTPEMINPRQTAKGGHTLPRKQLLLTIHVDMAPLPCHLLYMNDEVFLHVEQQVTYFYFTQILQKCCKLLTRQKTRDYNMTCNRC